ncbi:MAG: energy transducer TonB [Candidatus Eisenbacteria bacterium]
MRHGVDAYFEEIARFERRLSGIGIAVSLVLLGATLAARHPEVVQAINDPVHFGFEGEEQYVRRIRLEQVGPVDQAGANAENFTAIELRKGGGEAQKDATGEGVTPAAPKHGVGEGTDELDLLSRIRALALEGPVIRSEELVVEKLVRPEYPDDARDRGIEGFVELYALVDTTGSVREVHIVGGSGEPSLERAATDAVLLTKYRPYLVRGEAQGVWACYRITFTLY